MQGEPLVIIVPGDVLIFKCTKLLADTQITRDINSSEPLSEPMIVYCQWDPWEHHSMEFLSRYQNLHARKFIWKYRLHGDDRLIFVSAF